MAQHAHDQTAEMSLLGSVILAPEQSSVCFLSVPAEAYYRPAHQSLASLLRDMLTKAKPIDPVTVLAEVENHGLLSRIPATYLHTLISAVPTAVNCEYYAEWVVELYARRRLWESCAREMQHLDREWEGRTVGDTWSAADAVARLRAECDELVRHVMARDMAEPPSLVDFLAERDEFDWLVPGLLERGDRVVITGDEGLGKSELMTQMATCLAASLHPFLGDPLWDGEPSIRVAVLDCENGRAQSRRRYRRHVEIVNRARAARDLPEVDWRKSLFIDFRPGGLNLLSGADVAYLERFVGSTSPDLLVVGPLYKLHKSDMNNEEAARELVAVLDSLRERHHCALLTEAHAGHGKDGDGDRLMRPRGSALFVGWPEFGFGLRRDKDDSHRAEVVSWRGQREERDWPTGLVRGHAGLLPWRPDDEYYDRPGQFGPPDDVWNR